MYNFERRLKLAIKGIEKSTNITPSNKQVLLEYAKYLKASGKSLPRQTKLLLTVKKLAELLGSILLKEASKNDMVEVIANYETSVKRKTGKPPSEHTRSDFKRITKQFYAWLYDIENPKYEGYPKAVSWIHPKQPKSVLKASELLTPLEVKKLINATTDLRFKALIAVCYECGLRIGEALTLKIKDVDLAEQFASLTVIGKTGSRQAYCIESLPLLMQWLDSHPDKTNPNSHLWTDDTKPLMYDRARFKLLQLKKKAKVHKRIYFHLFRHSSATKNADLGEPMLRKVYGWSRKSDQPSTYIHLSGEAVKNALLQKHGLQRKAEKEFILKCPRCGSPNQPEASICVRCHSVLKLQDAISISDVQNKLEKQNKLIEKMKFQIDMMQKGIQERDKQYFKTRYPLLFKKKLAENSES